MVFSEFHGIYVKGCQICVNTTKTTYKFNAIANILKRTFDVLCIVTSNIYFLVAVSYFWFKIHYKWYQGQDLNVRTCIYPSIYQSIWCYIQLYDLKSMEVDWESSKDFKTYCDSYNMLSVLMKEEKDMQFSSFFLFMWMLILKIQEKKPQRYFISQGCSACGNPYFLQGDIW